MNAMFNIKKTTDPVTVLYFEGRLDKEAEDRVVENARAVLDTGARFLLIDMQGVEMVTSAGLRALHSIYKMFTPLEEAQGWQVEHAGETFKSPYFKLSRLSPQVHYVLSISGFLQNIAMYPDLQEALDSFPS